MISPKRKERRTLHVDQWPVADRLAWQEACRPSVRLKPGGSASYLAPVSQEDFARRYGLFVGYLKLISRLDLNAPAASQVTPPNVAAYLVHLAARVSSVTAWNSIYKLRRAAELLRPEQDFTWLAEIEKDLALVMEPRSKLDRLVFTEQLVEAGLTLIIEAKSKEKADLRRALGIRNGLMLALLALCPVRLKNFAGLNLNGTFRQIRGTWWIVLSGLNMKMRRPEERPIPPWLNPFIELYLNEARPILLGAVVGIDAMWISSVTGRAMTKKKVGALITDITRQTLGVGISPHLFRMAGATTAAESHTDLRHLASALLGHTDAGVTDEHYTRRNCITASKTYSALIWKHHGGRPADS